MKRHLQKLLLVWIMSPFLTILILSFRLPAQAAVSGDDFVTEITGDFTDATSVDVDSQGNIFIGSNNYVWRSQDGGDTWTKVLDIGKTVTNVPYLLYVDSNDIIHTNLWNTSNLYSQYRSIDGGDSWENVWQNKELTWYMDEASNGTLYMNTYCSLSGGDYIYKSTDSGATWNVWYNITGVKHIHNVQVNDYNDTQIYVATGDDKPSSEQRYLYYDGSSWSNLTTSYTAVGIWFDSSYVYFGADAHWLNWRLPHGGTWD